MSGSVAITTPSRASDASPPGTPLHGELITQVALEVLLDPRTFDIYHEAHLRREHDRYARTRTVIDMIFDRLDIVERYGHAAELIRLQLENYFMSDEAFWPMSAPSWTATTEVVAYDAGACGGGRGGNGGPAAAHASRLQCDAGQ